MLEHMGHNVPTVINALNPIIRGWANYFRTQVASQTFNGLDNFMFKRNLRFVKRLHLNKPKYWLDLKYFGKRNPYRNDLWVFGDKDTPELYLTKFSWTKIRRHTMVKGKNSPDDPSLNGYWKARELSKIKDMPPKPQRLARQQQGKCPLCGESLFIQEDIEKHHIMRRDEGGVDTSDNLVLLHLYCHQQITDAQRKTIRESKALAKK